MYNNVRLQGRRRPAEQEAYELTCTVISGAEILKYPIVHNILRVAPTGPNIRDLQCERSRTEKTAEQKAYGNQRSGDIEVTDLA
jgi:hypothetical protein